MVAKALPRALQQSEYTEDVPDKFDPREIFGMFYSLFLYYPLLTLCHFLIPSFSTSISDLIRSINDPEHPVTLEELRVVQEGSFRYFLASFFSCCCCSLSHSLTHSHSHSLSLSFCSYYPAIPFQITYHCPHVIPKQLLSYIVFLEQIDVNDDENYVRVRFTPTIPHCSMATLIGLCIRVRLLRCLPPRFKVRGAQFHKSIFYTWQCMCSFRVQNGFIGKCLNVHENECMQVCM